MSNTATKRSASKGAVLMNEGRQWIKIANIEWPDECQPRSGLDLEWARTLGIYRKEGSEFPPARIYQLPGGRLVASEAYHRRKALLDLGESDMLCEVVNGSHEDAIVFAAGSNHSNGVKPMDAKDITKAIDMLMSIDAWWSKSDESIGEHVGCSRSKVAIRRATISLRDGKALPDVRTRSNGMPWTRRPAKKNDPSFIYRGGNGFQATHDGAVYSGKTRNIVKNEIEEHKQEAALSRSRESIMNRLHAKGMTELFPSGSMGSHCRLSGYKSPGLVCVPCDFRGANDAVVFAVGQLVAAKQFADPTARGIIVGYVEDAKKEVVAIYRAAGIEFMTPEELESLLSSNRKTA